MKAYWEEYCKNFSDDSFYFYRCSNCKEDAPKRRGIQYRPSKCPKCEAQMQALNMEEAD